MFKKKLLLAKGVVLPGTLKFSKVDVTVIVFAPASESSKVSTENLILEAETDHEKEADDLNVGLTEAVKL